jgi:hypothetical protein
MPNCYIAISTSPNGYREYWQWDGLLRLEQDNIVVSVVFKQVLKPWLVHRIVDWARRASTRPRADFPFLISSVPCDGPRSVTGDQDWVIGGEAASYILQEFT